MWLWKPSCCATPPPAATFDTAAPPPSQEKLRDGGTHRPHKGGGGDSFGLSLEQTAIPGWCQPDGSTGQMGAEGEAPRSSRVATGEGESGITPWDTATDLQGCQPAVCPPWEFGDRYRRLGTRNGLREGSEWDDTSIIPPDKAQSPRPCLVPSQESPMCSWVTPDKHPFSPLCCHQVTVQSPETSLEGIFLFHLQQHARQPCQRSGTSAPDLGWH